MKRSGFANKPRKPLKRTPLRAVASLQTSRHKPKTAPKSKVKAKKDKLPTVKKMRAKCDKLLTPIIKKLYPQCIFTGEPTQVAHHAIKKSTSSALRYYLPNLIPLTNQSHLRLHSDEILWTGKLIQVKGMDWWEDLMEKKNVYTKCDVHWYIENYNRLKELLDSLN